MKVNSIPLVNKGQATGPQPPRRVMAGMVGAQLTIAGWLDGRSELFSALGGFSVTRRTVLALHLILACVAVAAMTCVSSPLVAIAAAIVALRLTYKLLKTAEGKEERV